MVTNPYLDGDEGLAIPTALSVLFGDNKEWTVSYNNTSNRLEFTDPNGNINYIDNGQSGDMLTAGAPHDSLSELGDDDHPQYLLADGTRAMSGSLDMGGNDVSNVSRYDAINQPIKEVMPSGWISGGDVSRAGGLDITVLSGEGFVRNSNGDSVNVSWSQQTVSIPEDSRQFISIDNTGTVSLSSSRPDLTKNIVLATVQSDGDSIVFLSEYNVELDDKYASLHTYTGEVVGPISVSGGLASTSGSSSLGLDVTAADFYILDDRHSVNGETDITFTYWYRDGSGGWNRVENQSDIDTEKYDDGSGTLADIPKNDWKRDVLFISPNGSDAEYHVVYAQETHSDQVEAEDGDIPTSHDDLQTFALRSTGIVVQDGATSISSFIDERPFLGQFTTTSSVTDHGNLSGLDDDDHTQYLLADGTRSMSGSLDLSSNDLVDGAQTIWNTTNQEIPDSAMGSIDNSTLTNSSLTVTAGDGLKNGGSVSLGSSTTVDIEPADFTGAGLSDDGSDNAQVNAGDGIEIDGSDNVTAIFGQDHTNSHSETVQDTSTETTWTDYITITPPTPNGTNDYRINWNLVWYAASGQGARFRLRNKTDGTTVGTIQGVGDDTTSNQVNDEGVTHTWGSTNVLTLSASKEFAVQYIHQIGTATQEIREANLEYWRVS